MKKIILALLTVTMLGCMFFSCSNSANTSDDSGSNAGGNTSGGSGGGSSGGGSGSGESEGSDPAPIIQNKSGIKFNFDGAQALAKLEAKKSRSASDADNLGDLVKILADGSMEDAVTIGENCSLSDVVAIYKSPLEDSKDVFIVFNGESTIGRDKNYNEIRVGQLICVHEDGSIADILKKENTTDSWNSHMSLNSESVTFDSSGNLYFISRDTGDMIFQYNPKTNELTKMVAAVENTWYEKMQIDNEGKWIFASGNRNWSNYFLRAIPINNPNSPVNIYYSSNWSINTDNWTYDEKNGTIYFIANDGNKEGLYTATKASGFKDKKIYHSYVGAGFENDLFEAFSGWFGELYWYNDYLTNGEFDSSKVVDSILCNVNNNNDARETVDIRFDKYWSATDSLKALAVLTKGKKNEEAFEALNNPIGMAVLCCLSGTDTEGNNWFENVRNTGYRHYFLADVLYVKGTDTLLIDSDESYKQKFGLQSNGLFSDRYYLNFIGNQDGDNQVTTFAFADEYYNSEKNLNATALKEKFFEYCNVSGSKEFRLTSFKDDEIYGSLYSTLTDEDAIEWIAANPERMNLFGQYAGMTYRYSEEAEGDVLVLDYASFMKMLSTTCFIEGTDEKAITWNWNSPNAEKANYYDRFRIGYNLDYSKLSTSSTGVYYEYSYTWGDNPYYYIVQVADANGKMVELVNKLPLPSGKVVQSEKNKDRILLQYSMMDSNGAELGYHHIYAVEMATGKVTNCFDSVPNRNNLEVVSFNSAGDLLYYSAVRGTAVENGIVNIVTNEYNPLEVQRKMVAVYTFD